jgi:hypothetical protein
MRFSQGIRKYAASLGVFLAVCLSVGAAPASAARAGNFDIYAVFQDFTWKEFDAGGQLLKENGPLGGIGFAYHGVIGDESSALTMQPRIEFFGGSVDYDGQTQAGVPVMTDTNYFGFKLEFDLGGRFGKGVAIEPFGGLGIRNWWRDINDSIDVLGNPVTGYTESWTNIYGRLGLRGDVAFSQTSKMFFEAVAKLPVYNHSRAYLSDIGFSDDVTVEPGKEVSFFGEVGLKLHVFKISAFYETLRFSESNVDYTVDLFTGNLVGFVQPKSEADIYGIRIGASF